MRSKLARKRPISRIGGEVGFTATDDPLHAGIVRAVPMFFALFLVACAGGVSGGAPSIPGGRNVGVVTVLGDTFHVQKVGSAAFGNEHKEIFVASWDIDDIVAGKVRTLLGRNFNVKPVKYRKSPFMTANAGGIGAMLHEGVYPADVDSYVVLTKGNSQIGATNQIASGMGILATEGLNGSGTLIVHALYQISVVGGEAFSNRGTTHALLSGESAIDPTRVTFINGPHRVVDRSWWPTAINLASIQHLKATAVELIDQSLPGTLRQLQLID